MRRRWAWSLAAVLAACCPPPAEPAPPPGPAAPARDAVEEHARRLLAEARAIEPVITPLLLELAERAHGDMVKLEHRFKSLASTQRKLRQRMSQDPGLSPSEVKIDDVLRYTMRVSDEPPGHYLEAVRQTLAALEGRGHRVERVKNYWPRGDSYSGINCELRAPGGIWWELQFHTPASFEVQSETRALYEELRQTDTPLARKRALFDRMSRAWEAVPVPQGALEPAAVHSRAELLGRARP